MTGPFGMLDDLAKKATDAVSDLSGMVQGTLGRQVLDLIPDGLTGLVRDFEAKGLGGIIRSWVGTGPNEPITADQVLDGLGRERVATVAGAMGLSIETVAAQLAKVLPGLVDALTPGGKVPDSGPAAPPPADPPPPTA
jgi:uncharacterized protein YidB (DUF937 family)